MGEFSAPFGEFGFARGGGKSGVDWEEFADAAVQQSKLAGGFGLIGGEGGGQAGVLLVGGFLTIRDRIVELHHLIYMIVKNTPPLNTTL